MPKTPFLTLWLKNSQKLVRMSSVQTLRIEKTTVSVIYRPPNGQKINFNNFLERLLQQQYQTSELFIIMGDININMISEDTWSHEISNLVHCHAFKNFIDLPTRITATSGTLIDVCL